MLYFRFWLRKIYEGKKKIHEVFFAWCNIFCSFTLFFFYKKKNGLLLRIWLLFNGNLKSMRAHLSVTKCRPSQTFPIFIFFRPQMPALNFPPNKTLRVWKNKLHKFFRICQMEFLWRVLQTIIFDHICSYFVLSSFSKYLENRTQICIYDKFTYKIIL